VLVLVLVGANQADLSRALGGFAVPWITTSCCVIPVGRSIGKYGPTTRRPIEDVVSIDRYGNRAWQG
jgi:hypothetical protein